MSGVGRWRRIRSYPASRAKISCVIMFHVLFELIVLTNSTICPCPLYFHRSSVESHARVMSSAKVVFIGVDIII